jgi:urease accessory protein
MESIFEVRQLASEGAPDTHIDLPFETRQRSRFKADLAGGQRVQVFLPRGTVLRDGALLRATSGTLIAVRAADEDVSTVSGSDATLTRVAYHLGNRHVRLQVGRGFLRYQHDRVLDDMVSRLGGTITVEAAPFEPEAGAYGHSHLDARD